MASRASIHSSLLGRLLLGRHRNSWYSSLQIPFSSDYYIANWGRNKPLDLAFFAYQTLFDFDNGVQTLTIDQYLAHVGAGFFLNCFGCFFINIYLLDRQTDRQTDGTK